MPAWFSSLLVNLWDWAKDHPWSWVQRHPILWAAGALLTAFGKRVWAKLEPRVVDFVAERLQHSVAVVLTGYRKLYAKHLYYKYRTFDVKGFSTQGKFALELENVYVDLVCCPRNT